MSSTQPLDTQLADNETYLNELMRQYENITQYLTYSMELKNTHNYLNVFLENEKVRTGDMADRMRNDVRRMRLRFMQAQNVVLRNQWYMKMMQACTLFVIVIGMSVISFNNGALPITAFYGIVGAASIVFFLYFVISVSRWQSRHFQDYSKIDWDRLVKKPDGGR